MKSIPRPRRVHPVQHTTRDPRVPNRCSLLVLSALGVLAALPAHGAGNALASGTLPVLRGVVAGQVAVNAPVAGASRALLTVDQASQRAILDWKSFNISSDAEVRFNQPNSTASVLNRIYGADPSVIQGKLTANGQVLLINQNGILFDRGAQVNVQSLVASTLNVSNARFNSGSLTTGGLTTPAFEGGYDDAGNTLLARPDGSRPGAIQIGTSGLAASAAPAIHAASGGSVILVAPHIDNTAGLITAPDGQVILAAGSKAYLALPDDNDPALRGFRVEIDAAGGSDVNVSSLIRNAGSISADRGNVTLAGLAINQEGRVSANTAIQSNGTVFLKARTIGAAQSGTVTLGAGSVTAVLPDATDTATLPESQAYADRRGEIRVDGRTIASSGTLVAAGGKLTLTASDSTDPTGARIYLDAGSTTSVAGNWADVSFDSNLLTFKVTSNELKNSPDQKTGVLKGSTVTVDLRKDSTLFDLSGYIASQGRTVGQKTAVGGDLALNSSGSLIERAGATLDASGGGYRYGGGSATTSKLLGDDGKMYDIATAPEARHYTAVLDTYTKTYSRWGQTQLFSGLMFGLNAGVPEAGYLEGKAGGNVTINSAAGLVLDGQLLGGVTVGPNQLSKAPRGATLTVGQLNTVDNQFSDTQRIGNVRVVQKAVDSLGSGFSVASALTRPQIDNVLLGADQLYGGAGARNVYTQTGFDSVEINSNGRIVVAADTEVQGTPGSSLTLRAPQIDVSGTVNMPAGTIALLPLSTINPISEDLAPGHNGVTVRSTARLSTAGLWVNNASADGSFVGDALPTGRLNVAGDTVTTTSMLAGGKLTIAATTDNQSATLLERGAQLDVGGGASLDAARKFKLGDGGTLSIANGASTSQTSDWLLADLSGLSAGNGGKLVISTPRVVINAEDANAALPANTTRLTPELFAEHGFSSITVNAAQGITVQPDTALRLEQKTLVIDPLAAGKLATGGDLHGVATAAFLPDDQRAATSLTLSARSDSRFQGQAQVSVGQGATIVADPGAKIALSAADALAVNGHISAPGGDVTLTLSAPIDGAPDLTVGANGAISVAGAFVRKPTDTGLIQGRVLDAGTITINAGLTGVNLAAGSELNLAGITRTIDTLAPDGSGKVLRQAVDGNAGTLVVRSQGRTQLLGTLNAEAGSLSGAGGSFALEQTRPFKQEGAELPAARVVVTQATTPVAPDAAFVDAAVAIDPLHSAGFQKLRLLAENSLEFRGDVAMDFARGVRFDAPLIDVTGDGRVAVTSASLVAIGQSLAPRSASGGSIPNGSAPVLTTRSGAGSLTAQAGTIDLFGSVTLNGTSVASFQSAGDVRLTGRVVTGVPGTDRSFGQAVGSLTTSGDLALRAAQVYPTTRSDFTLTAGKQSDGSTAAGSRVTIASSGGVAGDVYSAGGSLTIAADHIVQGGTVKAPLGSINLQAGSLLELAPGSVTSVSAGDLTIPFGFTRAGLNWSYQDNRAGGTANLLTTASADNKRIRLSATDIQVKSGAVVDLSGGGELQAVEFVPGNGGSVDTFSKPNTYAIIPKAKLSSMPVDTDTATRYATDTSGKATAIGAQSSTLDTNVYDTLHIGAGGVVPEGDYVLLPGRYALLPDAYLVQLQTGSTYAQLAPGQTSQLLNGQTVLSGYRMAAGTSIRESRTVGVVVRPGSAATREADYTVSSSAYFNELASRQGSAAPRVPLDAGRLAIVGAQVLSLEGRVDSDPASVNTATRTATGRSAEVDISSDRIAVVDQIGNASFGAGVLQLDGAQLSALGGSLLLGGERSETPGATQITTRASSVVVANTAAGALSLGEVLLTASDAIEVRQGAVVAGTGAAGAASQTLKTDAGGALLRVAAGAQDRVDRGAAVDASHGDIRIEAGATLKADGALLLDATHSTQSLGSLNVANGASVSLASSQVSLGETAGVAGIDTGLVLSNADLEGLARLSALTLKGYQGIDLYGHTVIGAATLGTLTLDSPALRGHADTAVDSVIAAHELQLTNSASATAAGAAAGAGHLTVNASRIVIGAGDKSVSGFASVDMNAGSEVVGQGAGRLAVASDWQVTTPRVAMAAGAVQEWQAIDAFDAANPVHRALRLDSSAGTAGTSASGDAGGRLTLQGRSVSVGTKVQARSGSIAVLALGGDTTDGVSLEDGAQLDASGVAKDYHGHVITADAGRVALASAHGSVAIQDGSAVMLDASDRGGAAGALDVAGTDLTLGGQVSAHAAANAPGGRVALDLGGVSDLAGLGNTLSQAGFTESFDLRVRQGDLLLAAGGVVKARQIQMAADNGRIDVAGSLDASSERGAGRVNLWAANGLSLWAGSLIDARGTSTDRSAQAALSDGGKVHLTASAGTLSFANGAVIDVSQGVKGSTGSVTFTVARDDANQMAPVFLNGTVKGSQVVKDPNTGLAVKVAGTDVDQVMDAQVVLEAQRRYTSTGALDIAGYAADHESFINSTDASALLGGLRNGSGIALNHSALRGATEVATTGSLSLADNWDLTTSAWLAGGQPGTLTLRAAGDLTLAGSLGNPDDNIIAGQTWNIRLVAGADLSAANPLATLSTRGTTSPGSVVLDGANAKLRTGTGSIEIAAASDFTMNSSRSVLYTAGRIGADDTATGGNNRWSLDGGDISIVAGNDVKGASDEWITEWLRRPRVTTGAPEWWAYRPNFQQGLGALGGGNVSVKAGHNVEQMAAMLPTTARGVTDSAGQRGVDVQGGGDLSVNAGNDVIGGSYLVARGDGSIRAGGAVGGAKPTQLFLMGVSSGDVPERAAVSVEAGGSITLQSVNNPTVVNQVTSVGTGPSFTGTGSTQVLTFFTYAADSVVSSVAKSGDVVLGTQMADGRGFGLDSRRRPVAVTLRDTTEAGAYPASVTVAALDGDITLNFENKSRTLVTYPSASAAVALLADGSVLDPQLTVSDRALDMVQSLANFPYQKPRLYSSRSSLSGDSLTPLPGEARTVDRAPVSASGGYANDIQARNGTITSTGADARVLTLPMQSRIEAGGDISGVTLQLQNLYAADLTQVRSDNGDVLPQGLRISGPGRLLVQAGRNIDVGAAGFSESGSIIGGLVSTGNNFNGSLRDSDAARVTLLAGVKGDIDLAQLDTVYANVIAEASRSGEVLAFYRALNSDQNPDAVSKAASIQELVAHDPAYLPFVDLVTKFPRVLGMYLEALKNKTLPLGTVGDTQLATALYAKLNLETDTQSIVKAKSLTDLLGALPDGATYAAYQELDRKYPRVFSDYRQRRSKGGLPEGLTPILYSDVLAENVALAVPAEAVSGGNIYTFQSSIQTYGNGSGNGQGSIDLWAPGGTIVAGLTTPSKDTTIGVVTNAGGAISSVVSDDFSINQGKVLTAQGGDILIYSIKGSIDAGKGARTSISTPPPKRTPVIDATTGAITGYVYTLPAGAGGSGIQSLTSDPDGQGPLPTPQVGSIFLTAPGGTIDAGEAGIRSGGNIVINAQTVLNGSNISFGGSGSGVPAPVTGSLAASVASSGTNTNTSKSSEDAANSAAAAARAAAAAEGMQKPSILTVEVVGFGDKNCKETAKDCLGK